MCYVVDDLKRTLEAQIKAGSHKAIKFGVHTGLLQAQTAVDLHLQLCPDCATDKPWETAKRPLD
jgi:hypothetical protein